MKFVSTPIPGLFLIKPRIFSDKRGKFIKTFHWENFAQQGLIFDFVESYYSVSEKNVLRGMHFQMPPHEHIKLVYVPKGKIKDLVIDLRTDSPSFGQSYCSELSGENGNILYIPKGLAHGFLSLEDQTNVTYVQTSMHDAESDKGIHYNSVGFDWKITNPIISDRDQSFISFKDFDSPFVMEESK